MNPTLPLFAAIAVLTGMNACSGHETDSDTGWECGDSETWTECDSVTIDAGTVGVPPNVGSICSSADPDPVPCADCATITLEETSPGECPTQGYLHFPVNLRNVLVGTPDIEVVEGGPISTGNIDVTNIGEWNSAFSFEITYTSPCTLGDDGPNTLTIMRVSFETSCAEDPDAGIDAGNDSGPASRTVTTDVVLMRCADFAYQYDSPYHWAAAGDVCFFCYTVCSG